MFIKWVSIDAKMYSLDRWWLSVARFLSENFYVSDIFVSVYSIIYTEYKMCTGVNRFNLSPFANKGVEFNIII